MSIRLLPLTALTVLLTACLSVAPPDPVTIQFLNVSDWHAQLDPLTVGSGTTQRTVGGAATLSAYFKQDRAANPNTLTLTGGDAYGGSPPLSSFFNEVPAIEAMNVMGFDADTFGNHNFDRGIQGLQPLIDRAKFQYVSANLENLEANLTKVKRYQIFTVGGVKVAVIGITNPEAPTLVAPGALGTLRVTDPVAAATQARLMAQAEGARVFVVIAHLGVTGRDPVTQAHTGPLIDFAKSVNGFDVIFGDHTNEQFSATINGALVIENLSKGATYSKVNVTVDRSTGQVTERINTFIEPVTTGVTPDPAVEQVLSTYRTQLAQQLDRKIGVATEVFARGSNIERLREVALGNLITDALRARYGTQLAIQNGGSIRSALPSSYTPQDKSLRRPAPGYQPGPPYDIVAGDVYSVLPFGNTAVTRTVTGSQLYAALENSVSALPGASGRFLQISGFSFTYDVSRPVGSRIVSVTLDSGAPVLRDATTYTLALSDFTNAGGDEYTMFADGQGVSREPDAQVVLEYIQQRGTITPATGTRIRAVGGS
ncbi:bifunctional UDP-sugar hydrolase/5'-nucleotidase [Deinococcus deserti]|uniref:Putative 5-nucleotidase n=1 Tax=Deinococcus deserti (strain DSM 17065 / CIP 109153 / LMG 22923 / VCD115) TaxID=546414 RepID=C1D489_DEIDV|nr:bifunctional UDP-sugar hydrolase/5'-nucleotidase [Deinococcus deserti]ACO47970.1 putative 5-nucleotidase [Deinococcus deserti VCD115]